MVAAPRVESTRADQLVERKQAIGVIERAAVSMIVEASRARPDVVVAEVDRKSLPPQRRPPLPVPLEHEMRVFVREQQLEPVVLGECSARRPRCHVDALIDHAARAGSHHELKVRARETQPVVHACQRGIDDRDNRVGMYEIAALFDPIHQWRGMPASAAPRRPRSPFVAMHPVRGLFVTIDLERLLM